MEPEAPVPPPSQHNNNPVKQGNTELIHEGKAKIYTKYITKNQDNKFVENEVFYNPIQVFNRDLSVLVMQHYINTLQLEKKEKFDGVKIVDALSASGLRTIRYLKELTGVKQVCANDISEASHKLMKDNFELNELDMQKIKMTLKDANDLMYETRNLDPFDIVDLDPYGSVVPFLQSAIGSIKDGGLLCATCTDTRVTCGPDLHKCYYFYGTTRSRVYSFQENALRIVLNTINSVANRHCRYIEPILSFQTEFYLRVFVRIHKGKTQCAESGLKVGTVYNCNSCGNYEHQTLFRVKDGRPAPNKLTVSGPNCSLCGDQYHINGPIWLANINNMPFVQGMYDYLQNKDCPLQLKTRKKIVGMLYALLNEKELANVPLGINLERMSKNLKVSTPSKAIMMGALEQLGFRLAGSYIHEGLFKTDASIECVYDILRQWKLKQVGSEKMHYNVKEQYSLNLLNRQNKYKVDFEYELKEKLKYVPQFFPHEQKHMGPKGRALKRVLDDPEDPQQKNVEPTKRVHSSNQEDEK